MNLKRLPAWCALIALCALALIAAASAEAQNPAQITILYDAFGKTSTMKKDWGSRPISNMAARKFCSTQATMPAYFAHNVQAKGIDLTKLDFAIASHRHGDHTSGLNYLLKVNPSVKIYAPQENFGVFGAALPGTFYKRDNSLPPEMRYFDGSPPAQLRFGSPWPEANFSWVSKSEEIAPGLHLILLNGKWGVDLEVKEISLAIDTPDGVVLIVGCSHPTIEAIVEASKAVTGKPIHLILGGLHLLPAKDDQIKLIARSLHDTWKVDFIAPSHCTGEPAFAALKEAFADKYVYAGLGSTVVLGPQVIVKAEAGQPVQRAMDAEDYRDYRLAIMQGPLRALLGGPSRLAKAAP